MFPPSPPVSAEWAPVYIEPLHGSGERFVVAVVCRDSEGQGAAKLAVRLQVLSCMYGDQADQVMGLCELIVESFDDHLMTRGEMNSWIAPALNCYVGPIRLAYGDSLDSILNQGIRLTASLGESVVIDLPTQDIATDNSALQVDRFIQQIKATVRQRVSDFESRFNRTVSVRPGAEPTAIGYLGNKLAANFDVLVPGSTLSRKRHRAKAKLLDLQALKDQVDLAGRRETYELMLWVPQESTPLYSEADMKRSQSVFLELEEIGDKHQLRVEKMVSPEAAAARIFVAEGIGAN